MAKLSSAAKKLMQENNISRDNLGNFAERLESFAEASDRQDLRGTSEEILKESKKLNKTSKEILKALKPSLDDLEEEREKKSLVRDLSKKNSKDSEETSPNSLAGALSAGYLFGDKFIGMEVARRSGGRGRGARARGLGQSPAARGSGGRGRGARARGLFDPVYSGRGSIVEAPGARSAARIIPEPPLYSGRGTAVEAPGVRSAARISPEPPLYSGRGTAVEAPGARSAARISPEPPVYSGRGSIVETPGARIIPEPPVYSGRGSIVETPGARIIPEPPVYSGRGGTVEAPGVRSAARISPEPPLYSGRGTAVEAPGARIKPGGTNPADSFFEPRRGSTGKTAPRIPSPLTETVPGLLTPSESTSSNVKGGGRVEPTIGSRTTPGMPAAPKAGTLGYVEVETPYGIRLRDTETGKFISREEANARANRIMEARRDALRAIRAADEAFKPEITPGRSSGGRGQNPAGRRFTRRGPRTLGGVERLAKQILAEGNADIRDIQRAQKVLKAMKYFKILGFIGAGVAIVDIAFKLYNGESVRNEVIALVVSIGTGYVGSVIGAAAGTLVVPGIGTVIGGAIGAFAGAMAGAYVAELLADIILGEERAPKPTSHEASVLKFINQAIRNGADPNTIAEQIAMGAMNPGADMYQKVNDEAYYWTPLIDRPDASLTPEQFQTKHRILRQIAESRAAINTELSQGSSGQGVTVNVNTSGGAGSGAAQVASGATQRSGGGGIVNNVLDPFTDPVGWVV